MTKPIEIAPQPDREENITFIIVGEEPLILTKSGFVYNGKVIEDAGEAYRLFVVWARSVMLPGLPEIVAEVEARRRVEEAKK